MFVAFFSITALAAVCLLAAVVPEIARGLAGWLLITALTFAACGAHLWGSQ